MMLSESALNAALLLANFADQASKENEKSRLNSSKSMDHTIASDSKSCVSDLTEENTWDNSDPKSSAYFTISSRARAVSLCSQDSPYNSPFLNASKIASSALSYTGRPLTLPNTLSIPDAAPPTRSMLPPQSVAILSLSHMDWSKIIPPVSPLALPQVCPKTPAPLMNLGCSAHSLLPMAENLRPKDNRNSTQKLKLVKAVLRKKFSWRDYPELEDCLIANREEYLKHSTMNYTHEQRTFNNRLTQKLLDIAQEHGYVFENFSFVMVRDRIRCYYKSYIQSLKKKGCMVGYSARKAGLI